MTITRKMKRTKGLTTWLSFPLHLVNTEETPSLPTKWEPHAANGQGGQWGPLSDFCWLTPAKPVQVLNLNQASLISLPADPVVWAIRPRNQVSWLMNREKAWHTATEYPICLLDLGQLFPCSRCLVLLLHTASIIDWTPEGEFYKKWRVALQ